MSIRPIAFARRHPWLSLVISLEAVLLGLLVHALQQLSGGLQQAYDRGEASVEMILASYTLRQSSDYLTRFARHYAVTGDPAYRDIYQQVLNIRRGEALRPKDYESVYWDLTEPYRSNAHPLLYPQALESILNGLPFSPEDLQLLKEAEQRSDALAEIEMAAFDAVQRGDQQAAIDALFSVDYLLAKHRIMKPIDEFMTGIHRSIEQRRQESLDHLQRQIQWVLWAVLLVLLANVVLYLRWPRPCPEPSRQYAADGEPPSEGGTR
jgi:hypothetical protein